MTRTCPSEIAVTPSRARTSTRKRVSPGAIDRVVDASRSPENANASIVTVRSEDSPISETNRFGCSPAVEIRNGNAREPGFYATSVERRNSGSSIV